MDEFKVEAIKILVNLGFCGIAAGLLAWKMSGIYDGLAKRVQTLEDYQRDTMQSLIEKGYTVTSEHSEAQREMARAVKSLEETVRLNVCAAKTHGLGYDHNGGLHL